MGAEKFEDLVAWQKARALTKDVYQATRKEGFTRDFGLAGQIQRACVSIMSNIAEGLSGQTRMNFIISWSSLKPPAPMCVHNSILLTTLVI